MRPPRRRRRVPAAAATPPPSSAKEPIPPILLLLLLFFSLVALSSSAESPSPSTEPRPKNKCTLKPPSSLHRPPLVIGHRGSSYNVPEHTIASYRLALELGVDYVEPDLVPTKDGVLVAVHSVDLNYTTNVREVFPGRDRVASLKGKNRTGYYVQDFTLEEVRLLKTKQRVDSGSYGSERTDLYDGLFGIPTFGEILDLMREWTFEVRPKIGADTYKTRGRPGLYVELKEPSFLMDDAGINVADLLLSELDSYEHAKELLFDETYCENLKFDEYQVPPLVVQCFDKDTLAYLKNEFERDDDNVDRVWGKKSPPLVLLAHKKDCVREDFWYDVSSLRPSGIGPDKSCLLSGDGHNFAASAIEHDVVVHAWTERLETRYLVNKTTGDEMANLEMGTGEILVEIHFANAEEELTYLFCEMGIDGIFAENPDLALRVGARGCPDDDEKDGGDEEGSEGGSDSAGGGGTGNSNSRYPTYESRGEEMVVVGLCFSFMGLFLGSLGTFWIVTCRRGKGANRRPEGSTTVPVGDDDGDMEIL